MADEAPDRIALRDRFIALVDDALAREELPPALAALAEVPGAADPAPEGTDQYALWSALISVSQEVKLQAREFRELSTAVRELAARPAPAPVRVEPAPEVPVELLEILIDTVERVERLAAAAVAGRERLVAAPQPSGWLTRLLASPGPDAAAVPLLANVEEGLRMTAARLRDELTQRGARESRCRGQAFDPQTMSALGAVVDATLPEGTVVEVIRAPWELGGRPFRTGQVKVSRKVES